MLKLAHLHVGSKCLLSLSLSVLLLISRYRNKTRANMSVNPRDVICMDFGQLGIQ